MTDASAMEGGSLEALLLGQSGELLLLLEPGSLRIREANAAAWEGLGYAREQLLGMAITDIVCALTDVFYWEEVLAGNFRELDGATGMFQRADGSLFSVEESVRRVAGEGSEWLALRARDVSRELREREQLALASSQLRATVEATADGILVRDQKGGIVNMNHRFAAIWRIPDEVLAHGGDADVLAFMAGRFADPRGFLSRLDEIVHILEAETDDVLELADGQVLEQRTHPHYLEERIIGRVYTYTDVTQRRQAERLARDREQEFRSLVESSPDNIIRYDRQARALYVNHMLSQTVDVRPDTLLGRTPLESKPGFMADPDLERYHLALRRVIETGQPDDIEFDVLNPAGERRTHHVRFVAERGQDGSIVGALAFGRDITDLRQAQQEQRIAAIAFESQEAIAITDADQRILRINKAFSRITGYGPEEAIGRTPGTLLKSGRHDATFYREMWDVLNHKGHWQGEIWNRRKDGTIFPEWLTITAVQDDGGRVTNYVAAFSDTTETKLAQAEIHALAFYDPLTDLPNRRLMLDRLNQTLISSERSRQYGAIQLIDLDHFKELNDTKGHGIGDLLLVEVSRRLRGSLRAGDTVARLGGDEFVVILCDLGTEEEPAAFQAETIAEKIRATINKPFHLQGLEHQATPSIGISLFHGQDLSVDELLKRADTAMYQAKRSGRNAIRFFDPDTHAAMEARIALEADLRRALPENQLRLYYQPQVDARHRITGAEVLLRWQHPQRGMVSPMQFIPLAEETGFILPIGAWVLESACVQLKAWELDALTRDLGLAVNVSARQFRMPDFVEQVLAILQATGADPTKLKLELTESMVLDNVNDTIVKMEALKEAGVRLSLDDFGTGYSSLAYLSRLPLDQVKIDKSFVGNIGIQPSDQVIVQTIIGMAGNLGLDVIAEGVESETQLEFLRRYGCAAYQGFLFGRPMPHEAFRGLLG